MLLIIVALVLPLLAWYLRRPIQTRPGQRGESVKQACARIPRCCYASSAYYHTAGEALEENQQAESAKVDSDTMRNALHEHQDRKGRWYSYRHPRQLEQMLLGAVGGISTGVTGFGVGVLGVSYLVLRRIPMRIAVGTSHFVILVVTGAAVAINCPPSVSVQAETHMQEPSALPEDLPATQTRR